MVWPVSKPGQRVISFDMEFDWVHCCRMMNERFAGSMRIHMDKLVRSIFPFSARVEIHRAMRMLHDIRSRKLISTRKESASGFNSILSEASSPLRRPGTITSEVLQGGKEHNVALVARAIDGLVLAPGEVFSYHVLVGRPSRFRGFVPGLELHDGKESSGIGGGSCQVSNLLYWLGIRAGLIVIERHRHTYDLFADNRRTVPFGCGATVFYNYHDLRMQNPHKGPIRIGLRVTKGILKGEICAREDFGLRISIEEIMHRFIKDRDGVIWRENEIQRTIRDAKGILLHRQILAHNHGRVMYDVPEHLVENS